MLLAGLSSHAGERLYDYVFFRNAGKTGMYPYSKVEYWGYSWVYNSQKHLFARGEEYHTPGNALELTYKSAEGGNWSVEINYPEIRGVENFPDPEYLSLNIKGNLDARISLVESGRRPSAGVNLSDYKWKELSDGWRQVSIPLSDFGKGSLKASDLSRIVSLKFAQGDRADNIIRTA